MPKKIIPVVILAVLVGLAALVMFNPPQSERGAALKVRELAVEVVELRQQRYQLVLQSYGTVKPRTQSELVPQVSGKIIRISPNFRNGGFFEADEVLIEIDQRDYRASVNNARASLIEAQQVLVQEQAQVEQAKEDWARLGNSGKPPTLVSREPQLKAAQAKVLAAEALLDTALANLERTRIVAPYAGRMLEKKVDVGQVVSANTSLANIYAIDTIEVRLPLKNRDLAYIELPETLRVADAEQQVLPAVQLLSELGKTERWLGQVVRTESAIDAASQQLYVIAQINDPYGETARDRQPLKIGQYVSAEISGRLLTEALVIPNNVIYQSSYVYLVEQGLLRRREITIAWQNNDEALIQKGLKAGEQLVITPLGQVASGTLVKIIDGSSSSESATTEPSTQQAGAL
jgi:RND family efflux transporter MFP subunit